MKSKLESNEIEKNRNWNRNVTTVLQTNTNREIGIKKLKSNWNK